MAQATNIEWTEQVWNFLRGCSRVSEGCTRCYAERQAIRHARPGGPYEGLVKSTPKGPRWTGEISFHEDALLAPLKRKKPTTYFVNSMSDLFHEKVKDEWLDKAFAVMALTPQHTYQILTKRPERMREYFEATFTDPAAFQRGFEQGMWAAENCGGDEAIDKLIEARRNWPLPNVWLGVSVEDQKTADERIPLLLQTPAAVRWISAEPLLGPVDLEWRINVPGGYVTNYLNGWHADRGETDENGRAMFDGHQWHSGAGLSWVVVGGESGPNARPFDIQWARDIIAQCKAADVPVFVKQLGAIPVSTVLLDDDTPGFAPDVRLNWTGHTVGGYRAFPKDRKGGDMAEWPEDLRIRQMPEVQHG